MAQAPNPAPPQIIRDNWQAAYLVYNGYEPEPVFLDNGKVAFAFKGTDDLKSCIQEFNRSSLPGIQKCLTDLFKTMDEFKKTRGGR